MRLARRAPLAIAVLAAAGASSAADSCREPIAAAETRNNLPSGLLTAIGQVESGLDPYAVNADGTAYHPADSAHAVALVRSLQRSGARFIDVGCLQVDLHYHPDAFASLEAAFAPEANVAYGAALLAGNHALYGDWGSAVAYYHSGDPLRQADYLDQVNSRFLAFGDGSVSLGGARRLPATAAGPKTVTLRLSFMTVTRPLEPAPVFSGGSAR